VKVLRDEGKAGGSGLGFAEFEDEGLALFAIRYLNNMELVTGKGLVADYSLEDARALHMREKRIERHRRVQERSKERKKAESAIGAVVELGKKAAA
jgi:hypothetical protein